MEIKSKLIDNRIEAANVLVEIPIGYYLQVAEVVLNKNEYQRKKVINSQIGKLLKEDLLLGATMPPIVLAITRDEIPDSFDYKTADCDSIILKSFEDKNVLILDGKQRTHIMLQLRDELDEKNKSELKFEEDNSTVIRQRFLNLKIRAEVYIGLDKYNILYRMLTLNTGQTTMSTRHLMEMLFLDFLNADINGIRLIPDKDELQVKHDTSEFAFKDALDGFYSYLEKTENTIERPEILENIKSATELKKLSSKKNLFEDFISCYKLFLDKVVEASKNDKINIAGYKETEFELNNQPFGDDAISIFKKSQAMSGFGAAIAELKDNRPNFDIYNVSLAIKEITFHINDLPDEDAVEICFMTFLINLDTIKEKASKIGNDQRLYFKLFFRYLFDPESDTKLNVYNSINRAYKRTKEEKSYF